MADVTDKPEEENPTTREEVGDSMEDVALDGRNETQNGGPKEHAIEADSIDQGEMTFEPIEKTEPQQPAQEDTAELPQPIPETPPPPPATSKVTEALPSHPASPPVPSVSVSTPETQSNGFRSTSGASVFSPGRSRTDSQSTTATNPVSGAHRNSLVFVSSALEHIVASKDGQKRKELRDAAQLALKEIKTKGDPQQIDPKVLFQPLRLATDAQTESVVTTALDCIGKLISYSYFTAPAEGEVEGAVSLIDQAIDTICQCFEGEGTADRVQLQIIISLLAAVLNDKVVVHGAGLLKAVRQMYNIFLHSKNTRTQQVAQGSLSQMVNTVFERARKRVAGKEYRAHQSKTSLAQEDADSDEPDSLVNGDVTKAAANGVQEQDEDVTEEPQDIPVEKEVANKMTLQTFERRGSFDEDRLREGPTTVTKARGRRGTVISVDRDSQLSDEDEEDEVYMKDAFLVFRAMCKISIKSLRPEEILDLRSQGMRAKLLSLHIVHTILFHNVTLFLSPHATIRSNSSTESTPFTQAVKQLLCQSLSRNGASSVNKVFEVGCEIFWIMLKDLRMVLKKEVEVFLKEIYLSILDNRTAPYFQKQCFLNTLARLAHDPRALVEIYLNYDCDRTASDNMYQRITEHLARLCTVPINVTSVSLHAYQQHQKKSQLQDWQLRGTMPSTLSSAVIYQVEPESTFPQDLAMKQQSLEAIVDILRSLVHWSQQGLTARQLGPVDPAKTSTDGHRDSAETRPSEAITASYALGVESPPPGTPLVEDDPMQLEKEKQMKTAMLDAVRQFNYKPKRGIKVLIENGFVKDKSPESIATFLLYTDRLDKAAIGEYLGEADPENVAIMHAFVDLMDFTKTRFTEALRRFLQAFRLPGEAQKIDRFMLKFAERYIVGNPNAFANADTAYVLAFSVIMLNTDQHSPTLKGKKRMTPEDFIKNNRGINDNADLPDDYLRAIFEEIASNEIVLDTEREREAKMGREPQPAASGFAANIGQAFATVGRDLQREAYVQRSEETANKTEQMFKSLLRAQKKGTVGDGTSRFIPATSYRHAGPMFDVSWMSILTALSGCAQDSENIETVKLCMEGLRLAVQIACLFDLDNPRQAFIQSITRFTNLYNLSDMKQKNVEALRVLLDVAHTEGNALKTSWRDILTCISQLDRFQLISDGVPMQSIPDVFKAQPIPSSSRTSTSRKSLQIPDRSRNKSGVASFSQEVAEESRSASIMNGVDRIFTSTSQLSGEAIVHFVTALCQVSWQEIESSGQSQEPRTYSLQKLVEVSEYNMSRVRFEWTNIWHVLGEHFNLVGCHTNTRVVHFALNSLRQLSIRFLDKEELPGFKFQKDFLKPFEHIINNATVVQVKEIVLHSLIQMIQARGENIRSGWRTIFGAFTVAARERFGRLSILILTTNTNSCRIYRQPCL
jgi:brefeldin A-inhibited guanine nucleotide-exchange protein